MGVYVALYPLSMTSPSSCYWLTQLNGIESSRFSALPHLCTLHCTIWVRTAQTHCITISSEVLMLSFALPDDGVCLLSCPWVTSLAIRRIRHRDYTELHSHSFYIDLLQCLAKSVAITVIRFYYSCALSPLQTGIILWNKTWLLYFI